MEENKNESQINLSKVSISIIIFIQSVLLGNRKISSSTSLLNKKIKREEKIKEKNSNSENKNYLIKNYISLVNPKNVSLTNKLKCLKRNLITIKYNNNCDSLSYDMIKIFQKHDIKNKNIIKLAKIVSYKNMKLIFFLTEENILIYEIKEIPFNLNFIKQISNIDIFNTDAIKYVYAFVNETKVYFNFFSLRKINLYSFNIEQKDLILEKTENYSRDKFNKYFYHMKRRNKFIIFKCDQAIIFDSLIKKKKSLLSSEADYGINSVKTCKELNDKLFCIIFEHSISLFDYETEELIQEINDIQPKSVKLINNNDKNYLMVFSFIKDIFIYELTSLTLIQRLNTDNLKSIKKIKQLKNKDIAIIYGDYNLAIYDLKHNLIKYKIINETKAHYYFNVFVLKNIDKNLLMYNPTRYSFHIIDYSKGQIIAKFSDGLNKIQKCKKICKVYSDNDLDTKTNYYFVTNAKGYFILKI